MTFYYSPHTFKGLFEGLGFRIQGKGLGNALSHVCPHKDRSGSMSHALPHRFPRQYHVLINKIKVEVGMMW